MLFSGLVRTLTVVLGLLVALPSFAQSILFSTAQPGAIDGPGGTTTAFTDGDVVSINPATGIGTIFLAEDTINPPGLPDMDALYVTPEGNVVFSTQSGSASFAFEDDQLVQYDVTTGTLSVFFDFGGLITTNGDSDIKGFHVLPNGNFLLANQSDYTLASQNFSNGDIVEYDPVNQTASLYFSESLFGGDDIWVRSVGLLGNGNLLLSAFNEDTGGAITLGGLTFGRGDLVEYDRANDVATLLVSVAVFGGATEDFDAVHAVPLPAAAWLLLSALGLLGRRSHRG